MYPLGGGKTMMAFDFAWSLERAHTSAGRVRFDQRWLITGRVRFDQRPDKRVIAGQTARDQNDLITILSNARCTHDPMHARPAR